MPRAAGIKRGGGRIQDQRQRIPPQLVGEIKLWDSGWGWQLVAVDRMAPLIDEAHRLQHQRHVAALHRVLGEVEAALGKVRDGTYGQCDACQGKIPAHELAHEPATTLCGSCRGFQIEPG